mmetsp:Transcript_15960/g.47970  ORF Transcript_15960/g.47970 Transcript_15960/m.47970 type:complete len:105 (+) Transcript_15960:4208-4522(+)
MTAQQLTAALNCLGSGRGCTSSSLPNSVWPMWLDAKFILALCPHMQATLWAQSALHLQSLHEPAPWHCRWLSPTVVAGRLVSFPHRSPFGEATLVALPPPVLHC